MKTHLGSVSFSLLWILILSLVLSACSSPLEQRTSRRFRIKGKSSHARAGGGYLAVSAGAVHIDEILAFLTEFLSYDCQSGLKSPMIPLRKDVVQATPMPEEYADGLSESEKEKLLLHWEQMKEEYIRMAETSVPCRGQN